MKNVVIFILFLFSLFSLSAQQNFIDEHAVDKKLELLAKQIEQTLLNENPVYFNSCFNVDLLLKKVLDNDKNSEELAQFNYGFSTGFKQSFDIGSLIISEIQDGGKYEFISLLNDHQNYKLLFRLFSMNGINYHEIELTELNGKYQISDVYIYLTGEKLSETIKRHYNSEIANTLSAKTGKEANIHYKKQSARFYASFEAAKYEKAFRTWQSTCAGSINKPDILTGIQLASYYDVKEFYKLTEIYAELYPNDPGYYLLSLEGLMYLKEYKLALSILNSLDKAVDTDPLLDYLRSSVCIAMKNKEMASMYLEKLINHIPEFEIAYYSLLDLYISDNKFVLATNLLDKMSTVFNVYKEDLHNLLTEYHDFIDSMEYTAWLKE